MKDDLDAARGRTQFRIRFATDTNGDAVSDQVAFYVAEDAPTPDQQPTLVVTYRP